MSSTVDPTAIQLLVLEKGRWKVFEADGDGGHDPDLDPELTATVAITDGDRHEIRIFCETGLRRAINIRSIKKCIIRKSSWIELTDQSNKTLAIKCREDDPNFMDFRERFITLIRLLKVKYEQTAIESRYPVVSGTEEVGDVKVPETQSRFTIKPKEKSKLPPPPLPVLPPEIDTSDDHVGATGIYDYVGARKIDWKKVEEEGYLVPTEHRREDNVRPSRKKDSRSDPGETWTLPVSPSSGPGRQLDRTQSLSDTPRRSWNCYACTLSNNPSDTHCDACGAQRPPTDSPGGPRASPRPAPTPRKKVDQQGCPNCQTPVAACPECQVQKWRCGSCTIVNPANAFECTGCKRIRDNAWQCHVCQDVIDLKVTWCRRCDVWRCQLCHVQNDVRENDSKCCRMCCQISI